MAKSYIRVYTAVRNEVIGEDASFAVRKVISATDLLCDTFKEEFSVESVGDMLVELSEKSLMVRRKLLARKSLTGHNKP